MVSSTSIRVRNTTNEETANNKSSFSKRRRPDSAYSSHQSIRDEEVSGESGGLNGSTQHQLEVYLQESQQLKSFASVDSNGTLPCPGLIEYSRTDRGSRGKYWW